jgi:putative intracellular protease/amidase
MVGGGSGGTAENVGTLAYAPPLPQARYAVGDNDLRQCGDTGAAMETVSNQFGIMPRRAAMALGLAASGLAAARAATAPKAPESQGINGTGPIPVAVVVGDGATLIDFAGPWEILGSAVYAPSAGFNVYSVAASRDPIVIDDSRGAMGNSMPRSGLRVVPDYSFADAPQPRVIIMGAQSADPNKLDWIRHAAAGADLTASVCTGAFVLAKTGLLDGREATTNRNAYDMFEKSFPKVKLVRGVRFIDGGTIATATGLFAGVDLALHITTRYYGQSVAQYVADYEEWPSKGWM